MYMVTDIFLHLYLCAVDEFMIVIVEFPLITNNPVALILMSKMLSLTN